MKKIIYLIAGVMLIFIASCEPQIDDIGSIGAAPTDAAITVDKSDPYNPVFTATAKNGFIYSWDLGNSATAVGSKATSYYPLAGDYNVVCTVSGAGGTNVVANTTFSVAVTDPQLANQPVWKELTGGGVGKTWVYNTDTATGMPDYCYQTASTGEFEDGNGWQPSWSWGQCVQITPDIKGEMVFDLNGGINFTYHHVAGDAGVKGTFILDADNMTLKIVGSNILDYNIECTWPATTATKTYDIKLLTDDLLVLWQDQKEPEPNYPTGWGWSFKRKGYTP